MDSFGPINDPPEGGEEKLRTPKLESVGDFARRIRSKFPGAYDDKPDADLVERYLLKNPVYASRVDLPKGFTLLRTSTGYPQLDAVYERAGREWNVDPNLLIEQGRQETINFKPDVIYGRQDSPAGARGAGQFMKGTAPLYGLKVDANVDERADPIKSINAQARYMRKLLDQFGGDESLALAGYNAGEHRKSLAAGKVPNIRETQDYVKIIGEALKKVRSKPSMLSGLMPSVPAPQVPQPDSLSQLDAVKKQLESDLKTATAAGDKTRIEQIRDALKKLSSSAEQTAAEDVNRPTEVPASIPRVGESVERPAATVFGTTTDGKTLFVYDAPDQAPTEPGVTRVTDGQGNIYLATKGEETTDENGVTRTNYSFVQESTATPAPQKQEPTVRRRRAKVGKRTSTDVSVGELGEARRYSFEQTGKIKLKSGEELTLDNSEPAPEGYYRFRDADGESYLFNTKTDEIEDESLKEVADKVSVNLVPAFARSRTPVTEAQRLRAGQVGDYVAKKYGVNPDDISDWMMDRGFVDIDTREVLPEDRYYQSDAEAAASMMTRQTSIGKPGEKEAPSSAQDTHFITRRDLRDMLLFSREREQVRQDRVLKAINAGEMLTPEQIRAMGVDPEILRSERWDDWQMAQTVGRVNADEINKRMPQFRNRVRSDREARIMAQSSLGLIDKGVADAELKAIRDLQDAEVKNQKSFYGLLRNLTGYLGTRAISTEQAAYEKAAADAVEAQIKRYGSASKVLEQREAAEAAEKRRQERVKNSSWLEFQWEAQKGWTLGLAGSAISGVGDVFKGVQVWTEPLADYIDSVFGTKHVDAKNHPLTQLGEAIKSGGAWLEDFQSKDFQGDFWTGSVPKAVGSTVSFLPASYGGGLGIALFSVLQMAGGNYDEAMSTGATKDEAGRFARWTSALTGPTEALGAGKAFQRLLKSAGGKAVLKKVFLEALKESGEEMFLNEAPQALVGNYLARLTFDPTREWDKGIAEQLGAAGVSATLISTIVTGLNHVRFRHAIRNTLRMDLAQGGPIVRDFGEEGGFYVFGKELDIQGDVKPLVENHREQQKEIEAVFDRIEKLQRKLESSNDNASDLLREIREANAELTQLYEAQNDTSAQIAAMAEIPPPDILDQRDAIEAAKAEDRAGGTQFFDPKEGIVRVVADQTNVPEGSVRVEAVDGPNAGKQIVVAQPADGTAQAPATPRTPKVKGLSFGARTDEQTVPEADQEQTAADGGLTVYAESDTPLAPDNFKTGNALWKNADNEQPVEVTGYLGTDDAGRHIVSIEGSETGVPLDELEYPPPPKVYVRPGRIVDIKGHGKGRVVEVRKNVLVIDYDPKTTKDGGTVYKARKFFKFDDVTVGGLPVTAKEAREPKPKKQKEKPPVIVSSELIGAEPAATPEPRVYENPNVEPYEAPSGTPSHTLTTQAGTKTKVSPIILDESDIITSFDEGFPEELQPRNRTRVASELQIEDIAANLDPERMDDTFDPGQGRPVLVAVNVVQNGKQVRKYAAITANGRLTSIRRVYDRNTPKAAEYRNFVATKGDISGINRPVYAAVINDPSAIDLVKFAEEANEGTSQLSAVEQAVIDAKKLDSAFLDLFTPNDDGNFNTLANQKFNMAFFDRVVPKNQQGQLISEEGQLSQAGVTRIRNAILAKAFGDSAEGMSALSMMAESTDDNVKNITNALVRTSGSLAKLKQAIVEGKRFEGLDITGDIAKALAKYSDLRDSNTKVSDYLVQIDMPGMQTVSAFQKRIIQVFDHFKRSSAAITQIIENYVAGADTAGDPNQQSIFGDTTPPEAKDLFAAAVDAYEEGTYAELSKIDLFDQDTGRESEQGAREDVQEADRPSSAEAEPEPEPEPAADSEAAAERAVEPIGQLGTGANVYFESEKYRVNDHAGGQVLLNAFDDTDAPFPAKNVVFDSVSEAVRVAEELEKRYPNGIPARLNAADVISELQNQPDVSIETESFDTKPERVEAFDKQPSEQEPRAFGADNKLVTIDRAAALREKIKKRLAENEKKLNAGLPVDPELLKDATELGVFYIEAGARKFADFAAKMIEDLGDAIRPYLKSVYAGAYYYPGLDNAGMDSIASIDAIDVDALGTNAAAETEPETAFKTVDELFDAPDAPLSDLLASLDSFMVYDDDPRVAEPEAKIKELEEKLRGIKGTGAKAKRAAIKAQIAPLAQAVAEVRRTAELEYIAYTDEIFEKVKDIARSLGVEVNEDNEDSIYSLLEYLTDGRYMEAVFHKMSVREYTEDLVRSITLFVDETGEQVTDESGDGTISPYDTPEKLERMRKAYLKAYNEGPFGAGARLSEPPDIDEGAVIELGNMTPEELARLRDLEDFLAGPSAQVIVEQAAELGTMPETDAEMLIELGEENGINENVISAVIDAEQTARDEEAKGTSEEQSKPFYEGPRDPYQGDQAGLFDEKPKSPAELRQQEIESLAKMLRMNRLVRDRYPSLDDIPAKPTPTDKEALKAMLEYQFTRDASGRKKKQTSEQVLANLEKEVERDEGVYSNLMASSDRDLAYDRPYGRFGTNLNLVYGHVHYARGLVNAILALMGKPKRYPEGEHQRIPYNENWFAYEDGYDYDAPLDEKTLADAAALVGPAEDEVAAENAVSSDPKDAETPASPEPGTILSVEQEPKRSNSSMGSWAVTHEVAVPFGNGRTTKVEFFFSKKEAEEWIKANTPKTDAATEPAHDAATSPKNDLPEPTDAQKEAGNYKKGHIKISGLDISVENPVGSERSGVSRSGEPWSVTMEHHYGYIKRSVGADNEQVDVFIKDGTAADFDGTVFVIDQIEPETGTFDEHKVMLGFDSEQEARDAYASNYAKDWKGLGAIAAMPIDQFKSWLFDSNEPKSEAVTFDSLRAPDQAGLFGFETDATGLFSEGGPAPIEQAAETESEAEKQRQALEQQAVERELQRNYEVFGEDVGDTLTSVSGSKITPQATAAARVVLSRRGDIEKTGDTALDLAADAAAAIAYVHEAEIRGMALDEFIRQTTIGWQELTPDQEQLYRAVEKRDFEKVFNDLLDQLGREAERTASAPSEPDGPTFEDATAHIRGLVTDKGIPLREGDYFADGEQLLYLDEIQPETDEYDASVLFTIEYRPDGAFPEEVSLTPEEFTEEYGFRVELPKGESDVERSSPDLASDSEARPQDSVRPAVPDTAGGQATIGPRPGSSQTREDGSRPDGGNSIPDVRSASGGTRGDSGVRGEESADTASSARDPFGGRSGEVRQGGLFAEPETGETPDDASDETRRDLDDKAAAQAAADEVDVKPGDRANIDETLPFLLPEQRDDVFKAEKRFEKGEGILFTNATGTGKTYTGLGVVKRFHRQGKTNILIVAPNDKILADWERSGKNLQLDITRLKDTMDSGSGPVTTTYANFRQNPSLLNRSWDLILFDESHYLSQNQKGEDTSAMIMLRAAALHPRGEYNYHEAKNQELIAALEALNERVENFDGVRGSDLYKQLNAELTELEARVSEAAAEAREEYRRRVETETRPKVVFLSATPFAYEKNIEYAEGYLFEYGPEPSNPGYNQGSAKDRFFMQHFGYRMRYNKLTKPDADVDTSLMEREFNEHLKKSGAVSGRMLVSPKDYSREVVIVESAIGNKIDEGLDYIASARTPSGKMRKYAALTSFINARFNYLARRYTLEAINARAAVPIVRKHLALGRKAVVFHDYNKNEAVHPFKVDEADFNNPRFTKDFAAATIKQQYEEFVKERPDLVALDLSGLISPIEIFTKEFADDVAFFNGTIPKARRRKTVDDFNSDNGQKKILVAQSDAGREGISLHDTSGKYQRVLLNLGLPVRPIAAVQTEGRIYRVGNESNAIQLYLATGTSFERHTFGTTISQRASTAENLALGSDARDLRDAFIDAYENADRNYEPSLDEGTGGKAADRSRADEVSVFEKAKTYYFAQQKKTAATKAKEGKDYFATPEPLGLKMVEWADQKPKESAMEPSAGHGAIARFFRSDNRKTLVEPSTELSSRLSLVTDGRIVQGDFEDLNTGANKADTIVMNPPFGSGGKTAIEHLDKAVRHLNFGGRIVALIPDGPATDKRFDAFMRNENSRYLHLTANIKLPAATFARAATSVATRIVVIDKTVNIVGARANGLTEIDLRDAANINELFDRIEHLEIPARPVASESPAYEAVKNIRAEKEADASRFNIAEFNHTGTGERLFVAQLKERSDDFKELSAAARRNGGYYSGFKRGGAIPGFLFKSEEARSAFLAEVEGGEDMMSAFEESSDPAVIDAKERIAELLRSEASTSEGSTKIVIAPVSPEEVARIAQEAGIVLQGEYRHTVDLSAINHIRSQHGSEAGERSRGQLPVTDGDLLRIPEILLEPDSIESIGKNDRGLDLIKYTKRFNGITLYVEEVRNKRHDLAAVTLYKKFTKGDRMKTPPVSTPKTTFGYGQNSESDGNPQDPDVLSVYDESEEADRRSAVRLLKEVSIENLPASMVWNRQGDRLKINLSSMEVLRRALEQVDINRGARRFGGEEIMPAFLGLFSQPTRLRGAVEVLRKAAVDARESGFAEQAEQLSKFADDIYQAGKVGMGTAVFYVDDAKLPQEVFHQAVYLGSVEKAMTRRHARAAKLDTSEAVRVADATHFSKFAEYSLETLRRTRQLSPADAKALRKAIIREETAAWIAEGSHEQLGLTEDQADAYLLDFFESLADKIYSDHKRAGESDDAARSAVADAFSRFEELDYARDAARRALAAERVEAQKQSRKDSGRNAGGSETAESGGQAESDTQPSPEADAEPTIATDYQPTVRKRVEGDASALEGVKKFPGVKSKTEFASLPMTQRAAGFAVDDVLYTVFSDRAAQFEAEKLIKENGIAGTIQLLESQENPDVHHAVASFAIQRILLDEAARIEETTPAQAKRLEEIARKMSANMSMRMTRAGRYVRAAGVILKNITPITDVAAAIYQDIHGKGAELPADVVRRIEQKSETAKGDLAEVEALSKALDSLKRENENLKKALAGETSFRKVSPQTAAARRRFAASIKNAHAADIAAAVKRLREASLIVDRSLAVELDDLDDIALMSIYDEPMLPEDVLQDFATFGADVLIDGLAKPDMMKPVDFDTAMIAAFGESVKPHLQQIHQEAMRLRNEWIKELIKDKQVQSIIDQFGPHLSEEEIDAILQERADELKRRQMILEMHRLRAERGTRAEDLRAIEGIIAKIASNDAAAVAAAAMIRKKPSAHELYRLLEALGIKGKEARDAIRDGSDVLERARLRHQKEKADHENELRALARESDADIEEHKKMLSAARVRARESQREISKELRRIGSGELRYRWSQLVEVVNTPRAIMASADLSFIFRQGGWFMVSRPQEQGEAFRRMWEAFGGKISEVGYDRAMEAMEQSPVYELAVRSGIDFAGLGKHGEFSITKGEEEFRNNAFKSLANLTKDTKGHAINAARLPASVIQKSDEIYTAFLDAQRLSTFASSAAAFQAMGLTFENNPREFRALAAYINDATGRSVVRSSGITNLIMQLPLFSPRFTVSRFRLLYKSTIGLPFLPPQTRKVVMKDAGIFYGAIGGITALAWLGGLSAGLDWDDDDFLKIQIGDHHIDLFAGLQQVLKPSLKAMTAIGRRVLGSKYSFGLFRDSLYIKNDRGDVLINEFRHDMADVPDGIPARFLRSKLSPLPSLAVDYGYDEDFLGKKFNWTEATLSRILPLGLKDVGEAFYKDPATGVISLAALTGVGYSNYPERPEKATTPAEKLASKINAMRMPDRVQDEQAAAINDKVADIKARGRRGENVAGEIQVLQASGAITERRAKALLKGMDDTYFESKVMRMPSSMLIEVRKVANDTERVVIDEILERRRVKDAKRGPQTAAAAPSGATIRPRR